MTIFYESHRLLITHQECTVWDFDSRVYRIRELTLAQVAVGRSQVDNPAALRISATSMIGFSVTMAVIGQFLGSAGVITAGLLSIAVSSAVVATCLRSRRPVYELRALYRGRPVCLLSTTDLIEFGQARRALLRAIEWNRERI